MAVYFRGLFHLYQSTIASIRDLGPISIRLHRPIHRMPLYDSGKPVQAFTPLKTHSQIRCGLQPRYPAAIRFAKVAEPALWNRNLKQSNQGLGVFDSMLHIRERSRINVTR
jgi:hypothetical protein